MYATCLRETWYQAYKFELEERQETSQEATTIIQAHDFFIRDIWKCVGMINYGNVDSRFRSQGC
jgi:hypothetical protein